MGDAALYDVLDYERDIEPHNFVQIFAGVGSGKTTFAEMFVKGDSGHKVPKKTILLITSRKSKVLETLTEDDLPISGKIGDKWSSEYHRKIRGPTNHEDHWRVFNDDWGEHAVYQESVACTNAFIENYMKYVYHPQDITTHLWELFDIIIVDEVHSVIVDATYQSAPFYIRELVNESLKRLRHAREKGQSLPACQHIILMTGTPDPLDGFHGPVTIDLMEECRNVTPKNVFFIDAETAKAQIVQQYAKDEKIIYFANHTFTPQEFCNAMKLPTDGVVSSFSKEQKRAALRKADSVLYDKMVAAENAIKTQKLIPEDVRVFVTTSRNKEGINIMNTDIPHMYIETHNRSDAVQMAGRLRNGVENLYIVINPSGQWAEPWEYEADFTKTMMAGQAKKKDDVCGALNDYLETLCSRKNIADFYKNKHSMLTSESKGCEDIAKYIDYAHRTFPYARYNYFKNIFEFYPWRVTGEKYQKQGEIEFQEALENSTLPDLAKKWFPAAAICPYTSKEERARQTLHDFMAKYPDSLYPDEEVEGPLLNELNNIFGTNYKSISFALKQFTKDQLVRVSQNNQRDTYHLYKLVSAPKDDV